MAWPYGAENWCNLEGKYLHYVAELSQVLADHGSITASICSVGIFGTKYVRDGSPLPSSIEIV